MWSIIRIILAVLNVLGAIAIFVLAGQDYGTWQNWAYTNFLHDVAVRGLPLDREELDSDNRVKAKLDGSVAAHTDKREQTLSLAHILLPLAVSETERERLSAIQTYLISAKSAEQLKADVARAAAAAK